jgi:plastocyanin
MRLIARLCLLTGLIAVSPLASAQAEQAGSETPLTVTLSNYAFTPAVLELQRGTTYRLHLVNTSGKGHDFSAPALFSSSKVAPSDEAQISDGAIEVEGGASVDVQFTPNTAGTYQIECTHFMHSMLGMTGKAVVN